MPLIVRPYQIHPWLSNSVPLWLIDPIYVEIRMMVLLLLMEPAHMSRQYGVWVDLPLRPATFSRITMPLSILPLCSSLRVSLLLTFTHVVFMPTVPVSVACAKTGMALTCPSLEFYCSVDMIQFL